MDTVVDDHRCAKDVCVRLRYGSQVNSGRYSIAVVENSVILYQNLTNFGPVIYADSMDAVSNRSYPESIPLHPEISYLVRTIRPQTVLSTCKPAIVDLETLHNRSAP